MDDHVGAAQISFNCQYRAHIVHPNPWSFKRDRHLHNFPCETFFHLQYDSMHKTSSTTLVTWDSAPFVIDRRMLDGSVWNRWIDRGTQLIWNKFVVCLRTQMVGENEQMPSSAAIRVRQDGVDDWWVAECRMWDLVPARLGLRFVWKSLILLRSAHAYKTHDNYKRSFSLWLEGSSHS
jgi:hypothetical protein